MDRLSLAAAVSDKASSSLPSEDMGGPNGSRSNLDLLDAGGEIPESSTSSSDSSDAVDDDNDDDLDGGEGLFHHWRRVRNHHSGRNTFGAHRSHSHGGRERCKRIFGSSSPHLSNNRTYWSQQSRIRSFLLQEHSSVDGKCHLKSTFIFQTCIRHILIWLVSYSKNRIACMFAPEPLRIRKAYLAITCLLFSSV